MRTRTSAFAAVSAAALVVLAACGGGGGHHSASDSNSATAPQPADVAAATRTIEINAGTGLRFDPAKVEVKTGETVGFKVANPDQMDHEFLVGDAGTQDSHEEEMKDMAVGQDMADDSTGFTVKPGQTKSIAFTFPTAGTFIYGCHEPGHYQAGMTGEITVT